MTVYSPRKWYSWFSLAQWRYNANSHSTIKMSFFRALYDYVPPNRVIIIHDVSLVDIVDDMLQVKLGNLQVGGYGKGLGVLNPSPKFYGVRDWPKFQYRVLMGLKMFNNL